nr:MAG TPA: hypothetical protein [Caudoviricetes sp.]
MCEVKTQQQTVNVPSARLFYARIMSGGRRIY